MLEYKTRSHKDRLSGFLQNGQKRLNKLNQIQILQKKRTGISYWIVIILLIRILTYGFGTYKLFNYKLNI